MATHETRVSIPPELPLDIDEADENPTPVPVLEKLICDPVPVAVPLIPALFLLPVTVADWDNDIVGCAGLCWGTAASDEVFSVNTAAESGSIQLFLLVCWCLCLSLFFFLFVI